MQAYIAALDAFNAGQDDPGVDRRQMPASNQEGIRLLWPKLENDASSLWDRERLRRLTGGEDAEVVRRI